MKSPFPGMDPFIEACGLWGDFHHGLICQISNALNDRLPDHYVSRIRERVYSDDTEFGSEEVREIFVEVQEVSPERQAVTHVEVLYPSSKYPMSVGRDIYMRERTGILRSRKTNLVEIDLLRIGERMPMLDRWPNSSYTLASITRSRSRRRSAPRNWRGSNSDCSSHPAIDGEAHSSVRRLNVNR
jgi:hypothetical protein